MGKIALASLPLASALGAGYALKHEEHVRVDIFYSKMRPQTQAWVDVFGGIVFLMPTAIVITSRK
jgi:TRAP-type mannitol/chloroaromatic compound transport system permease small subunit